MAGSGMEVDPPTTSSISMASGPPLKRSNSAPMINILASVCPSSPTTTRRNEYGLFSSSTSTSGTTGTTTSTLSNNYTSSPSSVFKSGDSARIRRYSASCSVGLHSPTAALKTPYRLDQLKHEERIHLAEREAAHEKEVQSAMQMSLSVDDLRLQDEVVPAQNKRPANFSEPLHVLTSPYHLSSSPSPTRLGKQCFSPSLQAAVASGTGTTPSPRKKSVSRRSGSPMSFRPSPLSIKRKLASGGEFEDPESYLSPPKRPHYQIPGSSTPEQLNTVMNHPLIHCISSSSPSESGSPEQQVPNLSLAQSASGSSAYTLAGGIGSSTSAFTFRPVRPPTEPGQSHPHENNIPMATPDLDRESNHSNLDRESNHSDVGVVSMDRDSNHSDMLNLSMDASPDTTFSPGASRPTQV